MTTQNPELDQTRELRDQLTDSVRDLAAANAEIARLKTEHIAHDQLLLEVSSYRSGMIRAEDQLAAANALLKRVSKSPSDIPDRVCPGLMGDIHAHLKRAGQ